MLRLDPVSKARLLLSKELNEFENELDSEERRVSFPGLGGGRDEDAPPPLTVTAATAAVPAVSAASAAPAAAAATTGGAGLKSPSVASLVAFRLCRLMISRLRMPAVLARCGTSRRRSRRWERG